MLGSYVRMDSYPGPHLLCPRNRGDQSRNYNLTHIGRFGRSRGRWLCASTRIISLARRQWLRSLATAAEITR